MFAVFHVNGGYEAVTSTAAAWVFMVACIVLVSCFVDTVVFVAVVVLIR